MQEILVGLEEIASALGTGVKTIRKWIIQEGLPAQRYSDGIYRISKQGLLKWIATKEACSSHRRQKDKGRVK